MFLANTEHSLAAASVPIIELNKLQKNADVFLSSNFHQ